MEIDLALISVIFYKTKWNLNPRVKACQSEKS